MRDFIGEGEQIQGLDWDGEEYIFMSVLSGDVRIRNTAAVSSRGRMVSGGKKEEGISVEKGSSSFPLQSRAELSDVSSTNRHS